ncbi:hypothetical protein [Streptomyces sp. NPDC097640]|uniref:hypothetical protein n=1 Tax=Streptomyces sp. NPDC097640 TaxID=3157229 RepID=UPI00331E24CC
MKIGGISSTAPELTQEQPCAELTQERPFLDLVTINRQIIAAGAVSVGQLLARRARSDLFHGAAQLRGGGQPVLLRAGAWSRWWPVRGRCGGHALLWRWGGDGRAGKPVLVSVVPGAGCAGLGKGRAVVVGRV